jgi:hypothetical protein
MPKACSLIPAFMTVIGIVVVDCPRAHGQLYPKLKPISPGLALMTAAETNQIPMTQIDASSETNSLHPGDSATFLGTLVLHSNRAQWILFVKAAAPDPKAAPAETPKPFVVNIFGAPISFESKPVPASLCMLGPFSVAGTQKLKPLKKDDSFSLNESFLGVGLDQAAAVILRRSKATNLQSNASLKNPPTNGTMANRTNSNAKLTPAEKRALSGVVPAMMSYFEIVQNTEGLEDLLRKLIDTPSLWSIIRHRGASVGFYFGKEAYAADSADWGLPASVPVYYMPIDLRINGEVALKITVVITAPHPPRLICGGVVGLLAEKPSDDQSYMTLRVISARRGAELENKRQNELHAPAAASHPERN